MTVGLVLVSHSARLAEGVAELARQMVQDKVKILPAGGMEDEGLGTSFDKILQALEEQATGDGVLVLLDLGSAILSTETAIDMLTEEQRQIIRLSYAPLVEGALSAALEAAQGRSLLEVQQAAEKTANPTQLRQLKPISEVDEMTGQMEAPQAAPPEEPSATSEIQVVLRNPVGLHARPASLWAQTASRFDARVQVVRPDNHKTADARSMLELIALVARRGDTLLLQASGHQAEEALTALEQLVQANFYESLPSESSVSPSKLPVEQRSVNALPPVEPKPSRALPEGKDPWNLTPISSGIALGSALLYASSRPVLDQVEAHQIAPDQIVAEQRRLRIALQATIDDLQALSQSMRSQIGKEQAAIFEAHAQMLQDPALKDQALSAIEEQHLDAASAIAQQGEKQARLLEGLDDPLLSGRAIDMRDSVSRVVSKLQGTDQSHKDLSKLTSPVVLIANELTPSDTVSLHPKTVLGICTVQGGPTSHTAILARSLGIPALSGLSEQMLQRIHDGNEVGLDGEKGLFYLQPGSKDRQRLRGLVKRRRDQQQKRIAAAQQIRKPLLIGGERIFLLGNVGSEAAAEAARVWGAEGIGLLRTEFLFASSPQLLNEQEQRQLYIKNFKAFLGERDGAVSGPIIVRTMDAGADKPMAALNAILGEQREANPALGLRGIRIQLAHPELLEQQLRALLLAAGETGIELQIMFPMITTVEELQQCREIFSRVRRELIDGKEHIPEQVPLGIMVEVPSAALMARELADQADFFSVGSNDLYQYTLACDRTNPEVAALFSPWQPAVLRFIKQIVTSGCEKNRPIGVCGELAGDVRMAQILIGLGVTELSMTPTSIPGVRQVLEGRSLEYLKSLAEQAMTASTAGEIEKLFNSVK